MTAPTLSTFRLFAAGLIAAALALPGAANANHSVLVEGEFDFDGDGLVGADEDFDTPNDFIFGTIGGALGGPSQAMPAPGNLAQNGKAIIVTSGRFVEVVNISGQVTLEAAPGVEAVVEAFLAPADPRINDFPTNMMCMPGDASCLQGAPGIVINAPANRFVVVRNITTRNWTDGVRISGASRVLLDGVRAEHNINHGIDVQDTAFVSIYRSSVSSSGFRVNPNTGDFPSAMFVPTPGRGIRFRGQSRGDITDSSSVGNFAQQISNEALSIRSVQITRVQTAGFAGDLVRRACRANTPTNLDQAEICQQSLNRLGMGIGEQPIPGGAPPFAISGM